MPRDVSSVQNQITSDTVETFLLVEIGFDTPLRVTDYGQSISWNGQTWQPFPLQLQGLSYHRGGTAVGSLVINNNDNVIGSLLLGEGARDKSVKIYQGYFDDSGNIAGVLEIFGNGRLNGARINSREVSFNVSEEQSSLVGYAPRRWLNHTNGFHHLPPDGTEILWKGEKYVLRSRS